MKQNEKSFGIKFQIEKLRKKITTRKKKKKVIKREERKRNE